MEFPDTDLGHVSHNLHSWIYQWSARQIDPGWVLDVGSELGVGTSLMQVENPELRLIGCDVNIASLNMSRTVPGARNPELIQAEGENLPFPAEFLSGVCLINILHLVDEPEALLAEVYRTLKFSAKAVVYIDLTKLPLRWEPEPLKRRLDYLLGTRFHLTGQREGLTIEMDRFKLRNIPQHEIYLRLGEKR